jgi:hypothetical protein
MFECWAALGAPEPIEQNDGNSAQIETFGAILCTQQSTHQANQAVIPQPSSSI